MQSPRNIHTECRGILMGIIVPLLAHPGIFKTSSHLVNTFLLPFSEQHREALAMIVVLPYLNNTYTLSVRLESGYRDLLDSQGQPLIFTTHQAALDHAFGLCHCVLG